MSELKKFSSDRKTIGLLCTKLTDLNYEIFSGCVSGAENADCNLVVLNGEYITSVDDPARNDPNTVVFDMVSPDLLDGLVVYSGAIGQFLSGPDMVKFFGKYKGIPTVSIAQDVGGVPSVIVDNYSGIYQVVHHLTDTHKLKKIAFIKGPEGHPEAEERFQAYKDALKERGIPFQQEFIAPGDFSPEAGEAAVKLFYDQKRLDLDAIVCVDDDTAAGVLDALHHRNISIPNQVVVTGFDDVPETMSMDPPLTTVNQPFQGIAEHAVSMVMNMIQGRGVDSVVKIPTVVQVRQSCGCMNAIVESAADGCDDDFNAWETPGQLVEMVEKRLGKLPGGLDREQLIKLVRCLRREVEDGNRGCFIMELNSCLAGMTRAKSGVENMHSVITGIRFGLLADCGKRDDWPDIENLFQLARVQIHNTAYRVQAMESYALKNEHDQLNTTIQKLTTAEKLDELWAGLGDGLGPVGVSKLALYKTKYPEQPMNGCEILYSYPRQLSSKDGGMANPKQIVDPAFFLGMKRFTSIVSPLIFGNEMLGYGVWVIEASKASSVDTLTFQLSGVLKRLMMMDAKEKEDRISSERNREIQNQVMPMLDSISQVSAITQSKIAALEKLVSLVLKGSEEMSDNHAAIRKINQDARYMLETLRVIDDIAESVNVLAINASIESTHAGSFGKGFSVIAKEIRRLSDSTTQNSNEISSRLNETVKNISGFVKSIEQTMESFQEVSAPVNEYMKSMEEISQTMTEMTTNSSRILEIMEG